MEPEKEEFISRYEKFIWQAINNHELIRYVKNKEQLFQDVAEKAFNKFKESKKKEDPYETIPRAVDSEIIKLPEIVKKAQKNVDIQEILTISYRNYAYYELTTRKEWKPKQVKDHITCSTLSSEILIEFLGMINLEKKELMLEQIELPLTVAINIFYKQYNPRASNVSLDPILNQPNSDTFTREKTKKKRSRSRKTVPIGKPLKGGLSEQILLAKMLQRKNEWLKLVEHFGDVLTPTQKHRVRLWAEYDMTDEQIAIAVGGHNPKTIYQHRKRALKKLHRAIKKHAEEEAKKIGIDELPENISVKDLIGIF